MVNLNISSRITKPTFLYLLDIMLDIKVLYILYINLNVFFFVFLKFYLFLLKDNCFTEFCCFLSNLMNEL